MVAKKTGTAVTNWEQRFTQDAAKYKAAEKNVGVGQFISTRGGILQYQGTPVPGNKLQCVVLDAVLLNTYYEGEFDPDEPVPPICYAFGRDDAEMQPHENAEKKQNPDCSSCKWNKFGSAEKGRGKACKNGRRLAVIHVDSLKSGVKDASIAFLSIPPTSLPGWAQYVKNLSDVVGRPPYAVITEIGVVPDPKAQFKVIFTFHKKIDDKKLLPEVFARHEEMNEAIVFPFQAADNAPKSKGKGKGKPAGRRKF